MRNNPYKIELLLSKLNKYEIKLLQKIIFITHKRLTSQHMLVLDAIIYHLNKKNATAFDLGIPKHRLDRIMSEIYVASVNSLHLIDTDSNSLMIRLRQLDMLKKLNLIKYYQEQFEKVERIIQRSKLNIDSEDFLISYRFNKLNAINKKIFLDREVTQSDNLGTHELDQFYWIEKSKIICEELNKQYLKILKANERNVTADIEYIIKQVKQSPLLEIYVMIAVEFLELNKPDSKIETIYQKLLLITKDYTGREDLQTISHFLMNLCVKNIKLGNVIYRKTLFDIINYLDKNNFILEKNIITTSLFKLSISTSLKEGKISWANTFLKKYADQIKDKNRDSIVHYNQALIYFYEKKYTKVQNELNYIDEYDFDDLVVINKKILLVQVYFELWLTQTYNYDEHVFQSVFRSINSLLNKSTNINEVTVNNLKNFIKYARKLYTEQNKTIIKTIYSNLQKEKEVAQIDWLISKFKQRIGR